MDRLTLQGAARAPLVQMLVLGGALFGLHRLVAPRDPRCVDERRSASLRAIEVSAELQAGLARDHQRRTGGAATAEQRAALVQRYLDDEVLYREALALSLDRGDVIVRRRLIQKMELLLEADASSAEPTEADLAAYLAQHEARFRRPALVSLAQVFVSRERPGAAARAEALRAQLEGGAEATTLGDPFPRGQVLQDQSAAALGGIFGAPFAAAVMALPQGAWSAPLSSAYGLHLVRVQARTAERTARLSEIRAELRAALLEDRRAAARREGLAALHRRYRVDRTGGLTGAEVR